MDRYTSNSEFTKDGILTLVALMGAEHTITFWLPIDREEFWAPPSKYSSA